MGPFRKIARKLKNICHKCEQKRHNRALVRATQKDDVMGMIEALRKGADANACVRKGGVNYYPLEEAQSMQALLILHMLGNVDLDRMIDGVTALISSMRMMEHEKTENLLKVGANPNKPDKNGYLPLCYAQTPLQRDLLKSYGASEEDYRRFIGEKRYALLKARERARV